MNMKKEDLDKCLDNLIIDGLIREAEQDNADFEAAMERISEDELASITGKKSNRLKVRIRPWIVSMISAAAIIALVIIPSYNVMNGRLCDAALIASQQYITASKGADDVSTVDESKLKQQLPELEQIYNNACNEDELRTSGWDLCVAYLRLHKKSKAVDVLQDLSSRFKGTEFGNHCAALLKTLN
jgi:hypothetical protein